MKVDCINICHAACCQDIELQLRPDEYERLKAKGAVLRDKRKDGMYELVGPCPNLQGGRCSVHGTLEQPRNCRIYAFLGYGCLMRRKVRPDLVKLYLQRERKTITWSDELKFAALGMVGGWVSLESLVGPDNMTPDIDV
ncbi:hypothetical protein A3D85_00780 [Candidatus Amesbacteria bacterium RIFCSPHIGHO2_02_FULL_47_9]|uniref:Uncharacterized protein n=1 Tax=Candidatus Amesbacteria bacterium RIFCSPHIGHO2_01_FULL_48_32b TaxID=1797253 RepID=A0A1F4YEQ8_9BACT|nr:MAG: hypothetical protein A2876_04060 [Candidatus Amesbacteria bacterium RIFCSPHIGHO2_01_FULL_48_32b]OGD02724.1 MAG: hypothetical protein A3D85_00780 [Candidatus Amesbacteria bacterium RIFCSPHIGHO2_02_FULL_47_9]OGD08574.1 MAG: hypothetical protein A2899_02330 [Candidatus Amesbacteria bacterium RIFCSPLOWO2_01_FULL_49_25]